MPAKGGKNRVIYWRKTSVCVHTGHQVRTRTRAGSQSCRAVADKLLGVGGWWVRVQTNTGFAPPSLAAR